MPNLAKLDTVGRINRAIDYITKNLDIPLPLEQVARAAAFSPYHFHRVFRTLVGETLNDFVKRLRLERALHLLWHQPTLALTQVALMTGFASSSDFSRSFKAKFGLPPSAFDVKGFRETNREKMLKFLNSEIGTSSTHVDVGKNPDGFKVTLRELAARTVAYIRVVRPFEGDSVVCAADQLVSWGRSHDLIDSQWLGYMREDPKVVPLEKCRYDVAVVTEQFQSELVSWQEFPAMVVAEISIAGPIDLEMRALDWLYGTWLLSSEYVPDHQPVFEAWRGLPFAHGTEHFELTLQLPVKKLVL